MQRGSTLIELVSSLVISSVLVAGISSAVAVSMQSLSINQSRAGTSIQASQTLDQLVTDLQSAVFVSERSATTIAFTVPDQNGDGYAERVRYSWTGSLGGPLTRQYNGGAPLTLAASVDLFSLTPSYKSVAESYPSLGVEDANESLLIDYSGAGGTGNNNVTATTWMGQYFTLTLPAGAYAWRPTSVQFMAKKNSSPGVTRVQMRPASASLTPTATILEEYTLADTSLAAGYTWEPMSFGSLSPLASGGGICLVLQQQTGATSLVAQSCNTAPRMLKTTNSGSSWTLDNGKCLVSKLYGKLTTSSGTQNLNSKYLTTLAVALRNSGSSATQQSIATFLNHPEMLTGLWELKFDQIPTTVDINGDAAMDWVVHSGAAFDVTKLVNGVWKTSGVQQLDTNPGNDFAKTTIVDVKLQNKTVGGSGAIFAMNALRNGSNCVPISANLALQADGTQTLTVSKKTNDATTVPIVTVAGLAAQPVLLHLIIDPVISAISIAVNDVQRGTFPIAPYASSDAGRYAALGASGSQAEFSYVRVRVLEE